jgi:predicted methyltransferase
MMCEDTAGTHMDIDAIVTEVTTAVGLAEGESGVRDVLRVIARTEPVPTSQVSRMAELPVPLVTAVCNELRKRGVVDRTRPVRLTVAARELLAAGGPHLTAECPQCGGLGLVIPAGLKGLADELELAASGAPQARPELDQTHCTVATKLHRVLKLHEAGALDGKDIILLGDDDLISVAIARFAALAGTGASVRTLAVVDTDPAVLAWIGEQTSGTGVRVTAVEHDLRQPLPATLAGAFDVACTDPPYTVPGAELFLSRAASALRGPGGHVFFSFGARRPAQTLATQRLLTDLGLVVRSLTPSFNSYLGAGILAGSSHLYHLRSTEQTAPLIDGEYDGPLYTSDTRTLQSRPYRCAACGAVHVVGTGASAGPWTVIADLKSAGCPACGGTTFRPMPRQSR